MHIRAIFDRQFAGEAWGAAWIADSPANRNWFESNKAKLAPNSALFVVERYASPQMALCHMIWGIQDHFPDWQMISVSGIEPALPVPEELQNQGCWEIGQNGPILFRT